MIRLGMGSASARAVRRALVLCLTAILQAAAGTTEAAVALWPAAVHLHTPEDEEAVATFRLANRSDLPQEVYIDLTEPAPRQDVRDDESDVNAHSLAPFVTRRPPPLVRLEPGEETRLTLGVRRPPGSTGTRWLDVTILSQPLYINPADHRAPRLIRRQRARVFHTPFPLEPARGEITQITTSEREGAWRLSYLNPTERVFPVTGEWRLTDERGETVGSGTIPPFLAYPGTRTVAFGPLPSLPSGTYHLLALLIPEGGAPTAGQLVLRVAGDVENPPW